MADGSGLLQYSFLLPVSATIAGWFVVARQADRREYRKEVREQIKELRGSVDELRSRATAYWLEDNPKKAAVAAVALKAEEQRLGRLTRSLVGGYLDFDEVTHRTEIRQLTTGGDFEEKNRKRSSADEERMGDIAGALEDLISDVDAAFHREFRPPRSAKVGKWLPLLGFLFVSRD